jgi:hypothetical protein
MKYTRHCTIQRASTQDPSLSSMVVGSEACVRTELLDGSSTIYELASSF